MEEAWLSDAQGRRLDLGIRDANTIGRGLENDIVLVDTSVSQRHAVISFDGGRAFLRDLGSSNGTFIEGARISGGELTDGSAIKFGRVAMVFRTGGGAIPSLPLGSCATCGELIGRDSQFCGRCGSHLVSPHPAAGSSQRSLFSLRTGMVLGALFLLGGLAVLTSRNRFSSSSSSPGYSGLGDLAESQNFPLPTASTDFVGNWCGWAHLSSCDPPGNCLEESVPQSMAFVKDAGGVVMQGMLLGARENDFRNIDVRALDSRHVVVKYVAVATDSTGAKELI
jgi:FHA domain